MCKPTNNTVLLFLVSGYVFYRFLLLSSWGVHCYCHRNHQPGQEKKSISLMKTCYMTCVVNITSGNPRRKDTMGTALLFRRFMKYITFYIMGWNK